MTYWVDTEQRIAHRNPGLLGAGGNFLLISGTAYFVYVGYTVVAITPKFVRAMLTVNGAGAQTAEVGLFSSTTAPNRTGLSLSQLTAAVNTATVDGLAAGAPVIVGNTVAFAVSVPAGVHLWAGLRTAMAVTQPTLAGIGGDFGQGNVQTLAGAGALTGAGPFAGAVPAIAAAGNTPIAPHLVVTLD